MYRHACIILVGLLIYLRIGYQLGRPGAWLITLIAVGVLELSLPKEKVK